MQETKATNKQTKTLFTNLKKSSGCIFINMASLGFYFDRIVLGYITQTKIIIKKKKRDSNSCFFILFTAADADEDKNI